MKLRQRLATAGLVAAAALACACAIGPSANLGQMDAVLRAADKNSAVALQVQPPQVRVGQTIGLQLGTARAGYLYVFQRGSDGVLTLVFPNAVDGANYLPGTATAVQLPRPNWRMTARGPAGMGYFLAVVADRQQDLNRLGAEVAAGRITVDGPYGAAMATLREVAP